MKKIPIVTIVGYSDSGKTRCTTELIENLTKRGYRIASAKHCHDDFDLDVEGKDSWKHSQAGAVTSIMSGKNRVGVVAVTDSRISLRELCDRYAGKADLLLAEGYSFESFPKILVASTKTLADERITDIGDIIAVVNTQPFDCGNIAKFDFSEINKLAAFLEETYLMNEQFDAGKRLSFSEAF